MRFQELLQQLESLSTHIVLIGIIESYTFESRIPKVTVELPNIIEWHVRVQLGTLFLLQNRWCSKCNCTMMRFIFQFAFLHLQLKGFGGRVLFSHSFAVTSPKPIVIHGSRFLNYSFWNFHSKTKGPTDFY